MKANLKKLISMLILLILINSCKNFSECETIEKSELALLIDISDAELYTEIKNDMVDNFSKFMGESPFGNIKACKSLEVTVGNLSGKDELSIQSATIGIDRKGLSGNDQRMLSNPAPIVNLIKTSLDKYTELSSDEKYNSSTNILQTVIKSIIGMGDDSDNTLLISSDMVINSKIAEVNFYKTVPKDAGATIQKLIDPALLQNFKDKIESGIQLKIVVNHKNDPLGKVNKMAVKEFWINCFQALDIENVQFIDNLTNTIQWD